MGNQSSNNFASEEINFEKELVRNCIKTVTSKLAEKNEEERKEALLKDPEEPAFVQAFRFEDHVDNAKMALELDASLSQIRASLVPGRIKEEIFWRNYFYLVYLENSDPFAPKGGSSDPFSSAPDPFASAGSAASDPFAASSAPDPFAAATSDAPDPFSSSTSDAPDPFGDSPKANQGLDNLQAHLTTEEDVSTVDPSGVQEATRELTPPSEAKEGERPKKKKKKKKKKRKKLDLENVAVEHVLATMPHVLLYLPIPNKRIADGHEASRWNVGKPKWQGMLKILVRESKLLIFQFLEFNRKLYLEAKPIPIAEITEEKRLMTFHIPKVIDSSRYFVIRVESPDGKQKFPVGLGFNKRPEAFDFQATLSDFQRMYVQNAVEEIEGDDTAPVQYVEKDPDKYKMKENEVWDPKLKKFVEKKAVDVSVEDFAFAPPPMKAKGGKVKKRAL